MKKLLSFLVFALVATACVGEAPPPATQAAPRVVRGGVFVSGGGGGSAAPTGTGFITVTGGAQDSTALAFPLAEAKGGTAATSFPGVKGNQVTLSTANYAKAKGYQWLSSDFTAGLAFFAADSGVVVTGVRFYYDAADAAARTIKFTLANVTDSVAVESITSSSITATTLATQNFASSHTLTAGKTYAVVARSASSGTYAPFDAGSSAGPKWCSTVACLWKQDGKVAILASPVAFAAGDTPTMAGATFEAITGRIVPLEPVFQ